MLLTFYGPPKKNNNGKCRWSSFRLDVALYQKENVKLKAIACASWTLMQTKKKYAQIERVPSYGVHMWTIWRMELY